MRGGGESVPSSLFFENKDNVKVTERWQNVVKVEEINAVFYGSK